MSFLPFENLTIDTHLNIEEAINTLSQEVEPKRFFRNPFSTRYKEFEGTVERNGFQMRRIIIQNNPFLPLINGRFEQSLKGTRVVMKMTLTPFVKIVLFLLFLWLVVGMISSLLGSMTLSVFNININAMKFVLLILVYLLITTPFKRESTKARKFLINLFSKEG